MKKITFDNTITNMQELIDQLESIKNDTELYLGIEKVFEKDYHALKIIINYLKEIKK